MEIQFYSKDKKIMYCNDDYLRITVKNRCAQWGISDVGKARVVGDTVAFVDNAGVHIADVRFKPEHEKRVLKTVELVNSQGKDISVPDSIFQNIKTYRDAQLFKKIIPVIMGMLIAIFMIRGASPDRKYEKDISYNTKLLVNQYDQLMEELKKANTFSSEWADQAMVEIEDIRIFIDECRKIEASNKYAEHHEMYRVFLNEFEKGADAIDSGMKTGKAEYGVEARGHFEKGLESLYQFLNVTGITLN